MIIVNLAQILDTIYHIIRYGTFSLHYYQKSLYKEKLTLHSYNYTKEYSLITLTLSNTDSDRLYEGRSSLV